MRIFRHTIAEYTCTKHCGNHRSVVGANMSFFHLGAAVIAAVPLGLFLLHEKLPSYCLVGILAGELLLLFAAGFISSWLLMPFDVAGTVLCKHCQAPMFFAGRHFDPKGSPRPDWSDIVIFVAFIALNVVVWTVLLRGNV